MDTSPFVPEDSDQREAQLLEQYEQMIAVGLTQPSSSSSGSGLVVRPPVVRPLVAVRPLGHLPGAVRPQVAVYPPDREPSSKKARRFKKLG